MYTMAWKDIKTDQMLPIIQRPEHVSLHFQSVTTQKVVLTKYDRLIIRSKCLNLPTHSSLIILKMWLSKSVWSALLLVLLPFLGIIWSPWLITTGRVRLFWHSYFVIFECLWLTYYTFVLALKVTRSHVMRNDGTLNFHFYLSFSKLPPGNFEPVK